VGLFDRLRKERLESGLEEPIRHDKVRGLVVNTIMKSPTDTQVGILEESLGSGKLQNSKLRQTLEQHAPIEMRKGIAKIFKKGKIPTVDLLLEEYRGSKSFQKLASSVGLDETWFVKLAEDELTEFTKWSG
jgi:hypothetical protein